MATNSNIITTPRLTRNMVKMLAFGGGTVGDNPWRDLLIEAIVAAGLPVECFFNPVVPTDQWNDEAQEREDHAKRMATHHVYYLASPMQDWNPVSYYSYTEAIGAMKQAPRRTVVVFDMEGMKGNALKQMQMALNDMRRQYPKNRDRIFASRDEIAEWLIAEFYNPIPRKELILLDGTAGANGWRIPFMKKLQEAGFGADEIFNPVVANYNQEAKRREAKARKAATMHMFYVASPFQNDNPMSLNAMGRSLYALQNHPHKTVIVTDDTDIEGHHKKSFAKYVKDMKRDYPLAAIFDNTDDALEWIIRHAGVC